MGSMAFLPSFISCRSSQLVVVGIFAAYALLACFSVYGSIFFALCNYFFFFFVKLGIFINLFQYFVKKSSEHHHCWKWKAVARPPTDCMLGDPTSQAISYLELQLLLLRYENVYIKTWCYRPESSSLLWVFIAADWRISERWRKRSKHLGLLHSEIPRFTYWNQFLNC